MRRNLRILMAVAAVAVLALSCMKAERGRVIPRGKMSKIYAEMLMMDQWISSHYDYTRMADTSFVYRPILEKYGYDEADYRASVKKYMEDPDRYSRILKKTSDILNARQKALMAEKARLDALKAALVEVSERCDSFYFLGGMRNPSNCVEDSLVFYVDSVPGTDWRFDPDAGLDTFYIGPYLEVIEKKECCDSTK